jgi:hypothetical protein
MRQPVDEFENAFYMSIGIRHESGRNFGQALGIWCLDGHFLDSQFFVLDFEHPADFHGDSPGGFVQSRRGPPR